MSLSIEYVTVMKKIVTALASLPTIFGLNCYECDKSFLEINPGCTIKTCEADEKCHYAQTRLLLNGQIRASQRQRLANGGLTALKRHGLETARAENFFVTPPFGRR